MITRLAMERGLLVLRKFAEIAKRSGASDIVAVATAALREAGNRAEFVERARDECGVDVRVISGLEEARLIHSSGWPAESIWTWGKPSLSISAAALPN